MIDLDVGKKLLIPAAIFIVLYLISLQLQGLALEPHVSSNYVNFYKDLIFLGMAGIAMYAALKLGYGDIFNLDKKWKAAITAIWIIFIISISISGQQMYPVPKASAQALQLTPETELYTSSVIPAVTEDLAYLWLLPMFMIMGTLMVLRYGVGWDPSWQGILSVAVIACFISSMGYNIWVLPGFTSAHVPAYGNNQVAYLGAFVFSFGQSMVYVATGWFVPIAHGIHNFMVTYGQVYQIAGPG